MRKSLALNSQLIFPDFELRFTCQASNAVVRFDQLAIRIFGIIRPGIEIQYVFYFGRELRIRFRNALFLHLPGLNLVFFSVFLIAVCEMLSRYSNRTISFASNLRAHFA